MSASPAPDASPSGRRTALFLLFTISGFAGLIYESIWSHYLKLFLGHAAYAQTLVLALFMGGMAAGAWLAGRFSARLGNLLRGYAIVEAVIGLAALVFHPVFVATTDAAYDSLLPALGSDLGAATVKWLLAALLILPQSVLLGATFPLMSGGLHPPASRAARRVARDALLHEQPGRGGRRARERVRDDRAAGAAGHDPGRRRAQSRPRRDRLAHRAGTRP